MKKVLIITYYWPPSSAAGVQRWLKFSKELSNHGWEPTVFIPDNPTYANVDDQLANKVKDIPQVRLKIFEPYKLYSAFSGEKEVNVSFLNNSEDGKVSFTKKFSRWVRGNFFIPDARKFWIRPASKFLKKHLDKHHFDVIVSTGPPHSLHLIAKNVSQAKNVPWLADFRDPWTSMDYYQKMYISKRSHRKHCKLEKQSITIPDAVTVVSEQMKMEFDGKYGSDCEVLYTGYESRSQSSSEQIKYDKLVITHVGSLLEARNPKVLWDSIVELKKQNHPILKVLQVKLVGRVDQSVVKYIKNCDIEEYVEFTGLVKHHEAIQLQQEASVLLLAIDDIPNAGFVLTSKLFEYIGASRPILCIGPTGGNLENIISGITQSKLVDFGNIQTMIETLEFYLEAFNSKQLDDVSGGEKFSIQHTTAQLSDIMKKIMQ